MLFLLVFSNLIGHDNVSLNIALRVSIRSACCF